MGLSSTLDPTLTPEGIHYFSLFTQYVPHEWSQAPHREELEAYADRIIDLYTELAPNFKRSVIDRQVLDLYDIERDLGMIGGNIFHGEICRLSDADSQGLKQAGWRWMQPGSNSSPT